jgi:hypothetical protein
MRGAERWKVGCSELGLNDGVDLGCGVKVLSKNLLGELRSELW